MEVKLFEQAIRSLSDGELEELTNALKSITFDFKTSKIVRGVCLHEGVVRMYEK